MEARAAASALAAEEAAKKAAEEAATIEQPTEAEKGENELVKEDGKEEVAANEINENAEALPKDPVDPEAAVEVP